MLTSLQLPLAPQHSARLLVAALRMLGGPGSGNFGHAGRPGQIGGSGEGTDASTPAKRRALKERMFEVQHETAGGRAWQKAIDRYVQTIDKERPAARVKLDKAMQSPEAKFLIEAEQALLRERYPEGYVELYRGVYLKPGQAWDGEFPSYSSWSSSRSVAGSFGIHEENEGRLIQMRVPIDRIVSSHLTNDRVFEGGQSEFLVGKMPRLTTRSSFNAWDTSLRSSDYNPATFSDITSRVKVIPVERRRVFRPLGGPGSGNFGHSGRPGQIGGSGEGNGPAAEAARQTALAASQTSPLARPAIVLGLNRHGAETERYVAAYGQEFTAQTLPSDVERGEPKECYRNASLLVMQRPDLTYAEGFASPANLPGLTFMHAWAVDSNGNVIDPTWDNPEHSTYFGVKYDRSAYLKYLYTAKIYGVMGSTHNNARKAIETGVPGLRLGSPDDDWGMPAARSRKMKGLGGPGSGNFGHSGRPGQIGGSGDSEAGAADTDAQTAFFDDAVGLDEEYPSIAEHVQRYTHDNDSAGIRRALADDDYPAYQGNLHFLLRRHYGDEITVRRKTGYAGSDGRGVGDLVSVSLTPTWRGETFRIPTKDVVLAGHSGEGELIVKRAGLRTAGGPGSGNFGHSGRPGEVGGSSSDGSGISQEARAIGDELISLGRASGKEHGIALGKDGQELGRSIGSDDSVDLPEGIDRQDASLEIQWHHNHPLEASLSTGDIINFAETPALQSITAHTDTTTYQATRVAGKDRELYFAAKEVFGAKRAEALDHYLEHNDKELLHKDYQDAQHLAMLELDQRGLINYSWSKRALRGLGDLPGHEFHGNQWTAGGGRSDRASESHKPSTRKVQAKAWAGEAVVKDAIGGTAVGGSAPMDLTLRVDGKLHGVEVKTLVHNTNDKITMHPESRIRKEVWARINKATGHTVVVDGDAFYYKKGFGAFRLGAMQRVESKAELRRLIRGSMRAAGGPGSGNFGHAGRPGEVGGSSSDFAPGHLATDDSPKGLPAGAETEEGAEFIVQSELARLRGNGDLLLYHEVPGDVSESIKQQGIHGEIGVFASINTPSNYVSSDTKTVVAFTVPSSVHFAPDMAYHWSDKLGPHQMMLKSSRSDLRGAYVGLDATQIPPRWIRDVQVVKRRSLGGPGSGNFGHAGRPGEVGGSADGDGPAVTFTGNESVRLVGHPPATIRKWRAELDALPAKFKDEAGGDNSIDVRVTPEFRNPDGSLRAKASRGLYTPATDDREASIQLKPDAPPYVLAHELGHAFQSETVESIATAFSEDRAAFDKLPYTTQFFVKHYSLSEREAFAQSVAFHLASRIPNRAEFVRAFPKSIAATHKVLAKYGIRSRQDK